MPKVQDVNKLAGVLAPIRDLAPPYKRTRRSRQPEGDTPREPLNQSGDGALPEIPNDKASPHKPDHRKPPVRESTRRNNGHRAGTAKSTPRALAVKVNLDQLESGVSSKPDNNPSLANPRIQDLPHLPGASNSPQTSSAHFSPVLQSPCSAPFESNITKDNDAVFAVGSSTLDSFGGTSGRYFGWDDSVYAPYLAESILGTGCVLEGDDDTVLGPEYVLGGDNDATFELA